MVHSKEREQIFVEEPLNAPYKNKSYEPFGMYQVIQMNSHISNKKLTSLNAFKICFDH